MYGQQKNHPNFLHYMLNNKQKLTWTIITTIIGITGILVGLLSTPAGWYLLLVTVVYWIMSYLDYIDILI